MNNIKESVKSQRELLKQIKAFIPDSILKQMLPTLVTSRLDYSNALFLDILKIHLAPTKAVLYSAARLILGAMRFRIPFAHRS